jgi:hypothetical protein
VRAFEVLVQLFQFHFFDNMHTRELRSVTHAFASKPASSRNRPAAPSGPLRRFGGAGHRLPGGEPARGDRFPPLTVDYREYTYASGRIPGGFFKREGKPAEKKC